MYAMRSSVSQLRLAMPPSDLFPIGQLPLHPAQRPFQPAGSYIQQLCLHMQCTDAAPHAITCSTWKRARGIANGFALERVDMADMRIDILPMWRLHYCFVRAHDNAASSGIQKDGLTA